MQENSLQDTIPFTNNWEWDPQLQIFWITLELPRNILWLQIMGHNLIGPRGHIEKSSLDIHGYSTHAIIAQRMIDNACFFQTIVYIITIYEVNWDNFYNNFPWCKQCGDKISFQKENSRYESRKIGNDIKVQNFRATSSKFMVKIPFGMASCSSCIIFQ